MNQSKILYALTLFFLVSLTSFALQEQVSEDQTLVQPKKEAIDTKYFNKVEDICTSYSSSMKLVNKMTTEIIQHEQLRKALAEGLSEGKFLGCRSAIEYYLNQALLGKIKSDDPSLYGFINLGLMLKLKEANLFIEQEIAHGNLNDWIDQLESENPESYGRALKTWAEKMSTWLRTVNEKALASEIPKSPELISIWSPILMSKYVEYLYQHNEYVTKQDLLNLNALYSCSTTSFRDIFQDKLTKLTRRNSEKWVEILRAENSWILFRMMQLMVANADGLVKRELVWMSENHNDMKVRSLAASSLDKIAIRN